MLALSVKQDFQPAPGTLSVFVADINCNSFLTFSSDLHASVKYLGVGFQYGRLLAVGRGGLSVDFSILRRNGSSVSL